MDPLTLLRELFGEEPIRKVVTSGFDSVHKIAATTPESLSFFTGINMALARQIQASAVESLSVVPPADYGSSLAGSAEGRKGEEPELPAAGTGIPPSPEASGAPEEKIPPELLDENPLLDAGGILKTVAREALSKEILDDDFFDEVGLSDAETDFLEGISPWPVEVRVPEKTPFVSAEARGGTIVPMPVREEEKEMEYASVTDWSPEADPDPVPRIVRAPELGPDPAGPAGGTGEAASAGIPITIATSTTPGPETVAGGPAKNADPGKPAPAGGPVKDRSLWRFGE
jgi:hypothetical protein